jgi:hypothetical protein
MFRWVRPRNFAGRDSYEVGAPHAGGEANP